MAAKIAAFFILGHLQIISAFLLRNLEVNFYNDTGSKPAIRIEFHVDVTNTFKESITYSVKETKNGSYKYTVSRCVHYEKKTFTSETSALDYVHDVIGKIYAE